MTAAQLDVGRLLDEMAVVEVDAFHERMADGQHRTVLHVRKELARADLDDLRIAFVGCAHLERLALDGVAYHAWRHQDLVKAGRERYVGDREAATTVD